MQSHPLIDRALGMLAEPEVDRIHRLAIGCLRAAGLGARDPAPTPDDSQRSVAFLALLSVLDNTHALLMDASASHATRNLALRTASYLRARASAKLAEWRRADGACAAPTADADALSGAIAFAWKSLVGRPPTKGELAQCANRIAAGTPFDEVVMAATEGAGTDACLPFLGDGRFVQLMYEGLIGRGATAAEIQTTLAELEGGTATRGDLVQRLASQGLDIRKSISAAAEDVGRSCWIMGTDRHVDAQTWATRANELAQQGTTATLPPCRHRFGVEGPARPLVAVITSLYRGARFIEAFMRNITSQQGFDDYCELIIVDACSPDREHEVIAPYRLKHSNIKYMRLEACVGIYAAWNVGIGMTDAPYITNANVDDQRRHDSLMLQAGVLENLPFVDVVYQDLLYTFDPTLSHEEIAAFGYRSALPLVTPLNIFHCNSPHNAPMWRQRLHQELGAFDETYQSAGDYEFWLRCIAASKVFYKINDPHVVYFQNPDGVSTRPGTTGLAEAMRATKTHARRLLPPELSMPTAAFAAALGQRATASPGGIRERSAWARQALHDLAVCGKFAASPEHPK